MAPAAAASLPQGLRQQAANDAGQTDSTDDPNATIIVRPRKAGTGANTGVNTGAGTGAAALLHSYTQAAPLDENALRQNATRLPQWDSGAQVLYIHTDHLGTPRELSDIHGHIRWSASYQTWGNTLRIEQSAQQQNHLPQLQPLRFQGQYFDPETGLHYNRFRYYDPDIGRFISQDPIGLAGGNNLYQYAANPVSWIDPLGLAGYTVSANTAGTDMLSRGVHLNVFGPGLPPKGGHVTLVPNSDGTGISFSPADAATRDIKANQWNKLEKAMTDYVNDPKNSDRLMKAAQSGIDTYPNSARSQEMKKVKTILENHKTKGTCPC